MAVVDTSDFRVGMFIKWNDEIWQIVDCQHHKMGRGGAIVRTKLKNFSTGAIVDQSFRSGERFERIVFDTKPAQYLYKDGDMYVFMDLGNYDQVYLTEDSIGEAHKYLVDSMEVSLLEYEGKIYGVELPLTVELKVVDTPPGYKGDTVSAGTKPATLETGLVIQVPMFINVGDVVVVDTRTGEYVERVKK